MFVDFHRFPSISVDVLSRAHIILDAASVISETTQVIFQRADCVSGVGDAAGVGGGFEIGGVGGDWPVLVLVSTLLSLLFVLC